MEHEAVILSDEAAVLPDEYHDLPVVDRLRYRVALSPMAPLYGPGSLLNDLFDAIDRIEELERSVDGGS